MSALPQASPLSGLARALVQAGRLKEPEAEQLISQAHHERHSLIEQIIASQKISSLDLARFVADTFGYPLLDLAVFDEAHIPANAIDRKLIAAHRVIPLNKRGNRLSVAIADPTNLRALDEIRFQTGLGVDPVVVEHPKLVPLVAKYAESAEDTLRSLATDDINLDFLDDDAAGKAEDVASQEIDDAPVVRSFRKCCSTPSTMAHRTSISNPTRSTTESASA
jgi:type IV pilus assembly protein PilB